MYLDEFFDYKNKLMEDILTNQSIYSLLGDNITTPEQAQKLAYTQVFPYEYIPDAIEDGKTFICFDVDINAGYSSKTFLEPIIYVWIFSHKSLLRLPSGGGVRTDKLASAIDKVLNGSRYYGMGELTIYSCKRFAPLTEYNGKMLVYHTKDFNRTNPTGKTIPSKRL